MAVQRSRVLAVARHEWRRHLRNWQTISASGVFVGLFLMSLAVNWTDYRRVAAANEREAASERSRWLNQGSKRPELAGDQGVVVFQPIPPLVIFDPGILPYVGSSSLLDPDHERVFAAKAAESANTLRHLGGFTPAMIVEVLGPLLIALLQFDAVAGERDAGTLSQVAAAGTSGGEFVLGKLLGASAFLGCLAAPAVVLTSGLIVAASPVRDIADNVIRIGTLGAALAAFSVFCIMTTLVLSCLAQSAHQALVLVMFTWLVGCFSAPRIASDVAAWWAPAPAAFAYAMSQMDATSRIPTLEEHRADVRRRLLEQYHVTSLRDLPVDPIGVEMLESDQYELDTIHPIVTRLYDAIERQDGMVALLGRLNPSVAVRSLSMALADADFRAHRRFAEAADQYRRNFSEILHVAVRDHPAYRTSPVFPGTDIIVTPGSPELWAKVPAFTYQRPTAGSVFAAHVPELISMGAWLGAAAFLLSIVAARLAIQ
jgi:ABC-2 type transport system permease protein